MLTYDEFEGKAVLSEASLKKTWEYNKQYDCANITAYRQYDGFFESETYSVHEVDCEHQKLRDDEHPNHKELNLLTKNDKKKRNASLLFKLKAYGYTMISIVGRYPENGKTIKEKGFWVVNTKNDSNFFKNIQSLGEEFEQDTVLCIPKGTVDNEAKAYLWSCTDNVCNFVKPIHAKREFKTPHYGEEGLDFTSYIKGKPYYFGDDEGQVTEVSNYVGSYSNASVLKSLSLKDWKDLTESELEVYDVYGVGELEEEAPKKKRSTYHHAHW